MQCMVPRHSKKNPAPHPGGASVDINNSQGQGKERRSFTLGEKKTALDFMEQRG